MTHLGNIESMRTDDKEQDSDVDLVLICILFLILHTIDLINYNVALHNISFCCVMFEKFGGCP